MNCDPLPYPYPKINSRSMADLKVKDKAIEFLKKTYDNMYMTMKQAKLSLKRYKYPPKMLNWIVVKLIISINQKITLKE